MMNVITMTWIFIIHNDKLPNLNSSVASDQRIKVVRIIGGSDLINTILLGIPVAWCDRPWFTRASDTLVHSETRRVSSRIFCWVHGVIVLMWSYVNYNINGYSKRERNVMRIISFLKGWEPKNRNIFFFVLLLKNGHTRLK